MHLEGADLGKEQEFMPRQRSKRAPEEKPKEVGDILGISDSTGRLPDAPADRGGHPQGIDVRDEPHGSSELHQGPGATSIDMGGGGTGNTVSRKRH